MSGSNLAEHILDNVRVDLWWDDGAPRMSVETGHTKLPESRDHTWQITVGLLRDETFVALCGWQPQSLRPLLPWLQPVETVLVFGKPSYLIFTWLVWRAGCKVLDENTWYFQQFQQPFNWDRVGRIALESLECLMEKYRQYLFSTNFCELLQFGQNRKVKYP